MAKKILKFIFKHKIVFIIVFILLVGVSYWAFRSFGSKITETRYVLGVVEKGTLITSISGSGQISVSNQVDLKPKVSGDVITLNIVNGQEVKTGQILAQLNAKDALKTVRDAEINLEIAKLSLKKLNQPTSDLSVLQMENSLVQASESKQQSEDDLKKSYEDGFNTISDVFLDLPATMSGLNNMFFNNSIDTDQDYIDWYLNRLISSDYMVYSKSRDYKNKFIDSYNVAKSSYEVNLGHYKSLSRLSDSNEIENLILETYSTLNLISDAIKNGSNYVDYTAAIYSQVPADISQHQNLLVGYISNTNSNVSSLLSIKSSIVNSKTAILNAERSIAEKTESLADLKSGPDALDVRSEEISIKQRENALLDAREKLADYTIRALFDGVVASVDIKKGDTVSAGTKIATLITKQHIAEIPLNEVDVSKVKIGQKVNLTFDAITDLNLTGEVAEIDSLGTVSQGVVTYGVKIIFDTQDDRVKPGMSVSIVIATNVKTDVLLVSNSAIKTSDNNSYVQILDNVSSSDVAISTGVTSTVLPSQQLVEIGLVNDTMTEIISGLNVGDIIINRIVAQSATPATQSQGQSLLQPGGGRPSGGALTR